MTYVPDPKGVVPDPIPMVELRVKIPKTMQAELQAVWKRTGITMAQQVRTSLALWLARTEKSPGEASAMIARVSSRVARHSGPGKGPAPSGAPFEPEYDPALDPEPDPATEPGKWASWSARQGNWAVKQAAQGKFYVKD